MGIKDLLERLEIQVLALETVSLARQEIMGS
jgi:hypothetical protein